MRQFRAAHLVLISFVIAIYLGTRLWGLTDQCPWFDEIFSVHAAQHAWSELFSFVALDLIHPPLFYALLKVWIALGGESLLWLRLLPVLFAILSIVPFLLLCRELRIKFWSCILALFLLATNGCLIKYAQEVRMYSMLMCLSLFSLWLFVRYCNRGVGIVALTIVSLLLVYTHYFGWLVIASEFLAVAIYKRDKWRQFAIMIAAVFAAFVPWVIAVWTTTSAGSSLGQNIGWMTRPRVRGIVEFVLDLIEPFYNQGSSVDAASDYRVSIPVLVILGVAFLIYLSKYADRPEDQKRSAGLLTLFIAGPVMIAFAASWLLPYSIWGTRHLIVVFPPVALLAAIAVTSVPVHWLKTAAVTLLVLFSGFAAVKYAMTHTETYSWCNWESQSVHAAEAFPAKIYVLEDIVAYHVWFALRENGHTDTVVTKIDNVPGVAEDKAYFLPRGFDDVKTVDLSDVREGKFWLGYRADDIDPTQQPLKTFTDAGYRIASKSLLRAEREQTIFLLLEKGN